MNNERRDDVSRREFLRATTRTAAAAGLVSFGPAALAAEAPKRETKKPALPYAPLGKTGYPVTRISLGAIRLADRVGTRIAKAVIDAGVNLVHTSESYGNGKSIKCVGALFTHAPEYRDKVFLGLKSFHPEKEAEIDGMLKVLGTDHVEVVCTTLHGADPKRIEAIQKQQDNLKRKGKVKHTGFVCHNEMPEVLRMVVEKAPDYFDVALIAMAMVPFPGVKKPEEADAKAKEFLAALKALKAKGVGIMAMKSGARKAVGMGRKVFEPHAKAVLDVGPDTLLTSVSAFEEVDTVKSLDLKTIQMTPAEKKAAAAFGRSRAGACTMCGDCTKVCPQGLPVSDLMRFRMYRDEYGWADHAANEFASLGLDARRVVATCGSCTTCATACPVGLASAETVRTVASCFA